MEYAVPFEKGPETVREVVKTIRTRSINTGFPLEFRTVAADDVWMSPFFERPSVTIAVHQYHSVDTKKLFDAAEAVFRSVDGRPHWGKRHSLTAADLRPRYPEWGRFQTVRARLDPEGRFQNPYTRRVLG